MLPVLAQREAAVEQAYARGETDEFVKPTVVVNGGGEPVARIRDGDALVFFNFRADRAREITRALTEADFVHLARLATRWPVHVRHLRHPDHAPRRRATGRAAGPRTAAAPRCPARA